MDLFRKKNKEPILPFGFLLLSLIGSSMILIYAIIRKDLVFFSGHIIGMTICLRNLFTLKKKSDYQAVKRLYEN